MNMPKPYVHRHFPLFLKTDYVNVPPVIRIVIVLLSILLNSSTHAEVKGQYFLRHPTGHGETVYFEFNGRIWFQTGNGASKRLTSSNEFETMSSVSPDGIHVAYISTFGNSREVFVKSADSDYPTRLTLTGGLDTKVQGWLSNNQVLYSTTSKSGKRGPLLFSVDVQSGQSRALSIAEAAEGCITGNEFAYVKNEELIDSNRQYAGGYAQHIFSLNANLIFQTSKSRTTDQAPSTLLTSSYEGISRNPVCIDGRVFFLSDRDGRFNLWSINRSGAGLQQHTFEKEFDVRSISSSDGTAIFFQTRGKIYNFNPKNSSINEIKPNISSSNIPREEKYSFYSAKATEYSVSDDGKRIALVNRGNLWEIDTSKGIASCIDCRSDGRLKSINLSSDGKTILALNDLGGEYDIFQYSAQGGQRDVPHKIAAPISTISASPQGRHILALTVGGGLYHVETQTGRTRKLKLSVDAAPRDISWSTSGRFSAFVTHLANGMSRITTYDVSCDTIQYHTTGTYEVRSPVFATDSKQIFFIAQTNFRSSVDDPWGITNFWPSYEKRSLIYSKSLSGTSAFDEHSEVECSDETIDDSGSRSDKLSTREMPFVAGNYSRLTLNDNRLYAFSKRLERDKWWNLVRFDLSDTSGRSAPELVISDVVHGYAVSAGGSSVMVLTNDGLGLLTTAGRKGNFEAPMYITNESWLETHVDLFKERRQMFVELWRLYRDYFWDPRMNGDLSPISSSNFG